MRSGRGISNDTKRRMDKEYGSGDEDGRRSYYPTNKEADKEREKDRLSSGEGTEEQRKGMGKRRRNDNLEKPDLHAKRSSTTRRHYSSPPQ